MPSREEDTPEEQLSFATIFAQANKAFSRLSPTADKLLEEYMEAIYRSSIAKCLDFNITANANIDRDLVSYFLVSNSRSICEELIYCTFFLG